MYSSASWRLPTILARNSASHSEPIAACAEHRIDPEPYLRDLFCLLREWSLEGIVALAPGHWQETVAEEPARGLLERDVLRGVPKG